MDSLKNVLLTLELLGNLHCEIICPSEIFVSILKPSLLMIDVLTNSFPILKFQLRWRFSQLLVLN